LKPRILFLVPSDYDALQRKGVDQAILERDEAGFFERVITLHPLALRARVIDLNEVHRIHEFSLGRALAGRARWPDRIAAPFLLLGVFRAACRIARAERIDLVRATDPYLMGLLAWWVSRCVRVPFCVSVHADYAKRFQLTPAHGFAASLRRVAGWLPSFVVKRADMVMPIREHMVAPLEASGAPRSAIRVIPHGIDMTPFEQEPVLDARAWFGVPESASIVSFVGRVSRDNYVADVVAAVERVAARRSDIVFVIVGEGPEEPELRRRLLGNPAVASRVRLFPFQSHDRAVALRRISMVALCLMGGFSLIEACAAGCPAIAYDVEWHAELVQNGTTGFLVPEHDVAAVAAAVETLVDHPREAADMGREARRRAMMRHDRRATSQIKRECYAELLQHAQSTRQ
jgi:glycosyltransferase involved in cell wall biosynthesis